MKMMKTLEGFSIRNMTIVKLFMYNRLARNEFPLASLYMRCMSVISAFV